MMVRIAHDKKDDKVDARLPPLGDGSLWAVGWMHFFWSAGTIMVGSLLPTFLTEVLHASHTKVGILEGR